MPPAWQNALAFQHIQARRLQLRLAGPLGLSGLPTAVSWVFYYKALKDGEVSTVAIIDKGSFVVAVVLSWLLLGERLTTRVALGCLLIVAGLVIASRK